MTTIKIKKDDIELTLDSVEDAIRLLDHLSGSPGASGPQRDRPERVPYRPRTWGRVAVGSRIIDYAVTAARQMPEKFTLMDLGQKMLEPEIGWKTTSTDLKGVIRTSIRPDDRFTSDGDGYWRFTESDELSEESSPSGEG